MKLFAACFSSGFKGFLCIFIRSPRTSSDSPEFYDKFYTLSKHRYSWRYSSYEKKT
jgi:hypothetical protein